MGPSMMSFSNLFVAMRANAAFVGAGTTLGITDQVHVCPPRQKASKTFIHAVSSDSATRMPFANIAVRLHLIASSRGQG